MEPACIVSRVMVDGGGVIVGNAFLAILSINDSLDGTEPLCVVADALISIIQVNSDDLTVGYIRGPCSLQERS